jgi:hypothetical protein
VKRIGRIRFIGRSISLSLALSAFLFSGAVWAGEMKFGAQPLEVDDNGALTKAGRSASSGALESVSDDEELWVLNIWAKIDKGADGPLYVEFYRDHAGSRLMAYSHEHTDYAGDKYVSLTIELAGDMGFHFDDTLSVEAIQIGGNDKKKVLAKSKLTLKKGAAQPAGGGGGGGLAGGGGDDGEEAGDEEPVSDQDIADSFAGGDEAGAGDASPDADPPPIDPEGKKGCRVDESGGVPWAVAIMLALAVARRKD